jgi:hypothetical protein
VNIHPSNWRAFVPSDPEKVAVNVDDPVAPAFAQNRAAEAPIVLFPIGPIIENAPIEFVPDSPVGVIVLSTFATNITHKSPTFATVATTVLTLVLNAFRNEPVVAIAITA